MIKKVIAAAVAGLVLTGTVAQAAGNADDAVSYRKALMQVIGGNFNGVMKGLQGKLDDPNATKQHADMLATSVSLSLGSFKQNTSSSGGRERTTASPEIWSKWASFEKEMKTFETRSQNISKFVAAGDTKSAMAEVAAFGRSCKACHDDYRKK